MVASPAKDDQAPLLSMYRYANSLDRFELLIGLVVAGAVGTAAPIRLLFLGDWFDVAGASEADVGSTMPMDTTITMVMSLVYIGTGLLFGKALAETSLRLTRERQVFEFKKAYVRSILRQDIGWFDVSRPEELATRAGESFTAVTEGLVAPLAEPVEALVGLIFGWSIAFWKNASVALCILGVAPLLFVAVVLLLRTSKGSAKRIADAYAEAGSLSAEALAQMRTVASLGLEERVAAEYEMRLLTARRVAIRASVINGLSAVTFNIAPQLVIGIGLLYGAYLLSSERLASQFPSGNVTGTAACLSAGLDVSVLTCDMAQNLVTFDALQCTGIPTEAALREYAQAHAPPEYLESNPDYFGCRYTPGGVLIAIFAVMLGAGQLARVVPPLLALGRARRAVALLNKVIDRIPPIDVYLQSGVVLPTVGGLLELRDVHFAYPSAHAHPILRGLSVRVEEGTVCALVGASGSGKSTIIALMERFYDPHSGTILLDGVDISTLNVRWLRAQLGLVSQEPVLFQGTVEENIRYGKEGATREEVEAAAVMANAHGFITTVLANGYDTQVGQGGGKLSGGQKQRVAIARALIRKPSVLLLDEATSALDNESEKVVQAALDEIMAKQKRTTIVIAHRLSTIRDADKIVVVSRGAVVEQGTHDQLLDNLNGHYFTLVGAARGGPSQSLRRESKS